LGTFDEQILAELKRITHRLGPIRGTPYIEKETLSKAAAVATFDTTLEVAGNEFSQFIIRTDGDLRDISYRVKNLKGGFTDEIELEHLDVVPGPVDLIQFKNDTAESGKSIFVNKIRLPERFPFLSGFARGRLNVEQYGFNETTWDEWRNNTEITIFASALRSEGTVNSSDITNHNAKGGVFILDYTAEAGTNPVLDLKLQWKDESVSDTYFDVPGAAFSQAGSVSTDSLVVYPGVAETANESVSDVLSRTFRVVSTVGGADFPTVTFSLGCQLIV